MHLNNYKTFILALLATMSIYYIQHIRTAGWVFEDSTWINGGVYTSVQPGYPNPPIPTLWQAVKYIPNRYFTMWTFYFTPNNVKVAHAINVGIHIFNGFLLAILINAWAGPGWIVGSLFLIHPLASQAVAYAAGRSELLSLTAMLSILWIIYVSNNSNIFRWIGLIVCILISCMIKPTLVAIICPLIIWTYMNTDYKKWLPGLGAEILVCALPIIAIICGIVLMKTNSDVPLYRWFLVQTSAVWRLLFQSIIPYHLSIDHAWWTLSIYLQIISVIALLVLFILLSIQYSEKYTMAVYGIGFWWLSLLPRLIVRDQLGWIREHHVYTALAGICITLGSLLGGENGIKREY